MPLHPRATGLAVPSLGQGTWNMERDDRRASIAALRAGLDAGGIACIEAAFPLGPRRRGVAHP